MQKETKSRSALRSTSGMRCLKRPIKVLPLVLFYLFYKDMSVLACGPFAGWPPAKLNVKPIALSNYKFPNLEGLFFYVLSKIISLCIRNINLSAKPWPVWYAGPLNKSWLSSMRATRGRQRERGKNCRDLPFYYQIYRITVTKPDKGGPLLPRVIT